MDHIEDGQPNADIPQRCPHLFERIPPVPFAIFALGVIFLLYQLVGGLITLVVFQAKITQENVNLVRWSTFMAQLVFILVPTILIVRLRYPGVRNWFRVHMPDLRLVLLAGVSVFALQQLLQGYLLLQEMIPLPAVVQEVIKQYKDLLEQAYRLLVSAYSPKEFLFVVLVVAATPALVEELFFRGLIQRNFESVTSGMRGAVITGLVFAAYHINPFTFVPLAVLGTYFGFLVYRSGNLALGIVAHFFNNFIACLAVYLQLSDDFVAVSPMEEPSLLVRLSNYAAFAVVFVVATYYFIRVTKPAPETAERGG